MQRIGSRLIFMLIALCLLNTGIPVMADSKDGNKDMPDIKTIQMLDLNTACRIALFESPTLAAAAQRLEQARQLVNQARGAYWPNLTATGSINRVRQSDSQYQTNLATLKGLTPLASLNNPEDYYETGLSASWTIFDGFRRHFNNAAAKYGKEQSENMLLDSRRLLLSAVAGSFYQAQLANENLTIATSDESFNLKQVFEARARMRVGTGSLSDVLNFEIQVNSARDNRIKADHEYLSAMNGLAALLGISEARFPEGLKLVPMEKESAMITERLEADELISYAYKNRPDILAAAQGLKMVDAEIGTMKAGFYPSVVLSGTLMGERTENGSFEGDDFGSTVGVIFSYDLFSGGTDKARVNEGLYKKKEELKNLDALKISVVKEINNALSQLEAARQQLKLQSKNASLVQRNRDLVEKEYAAGQSSLVRLNEAQRNLTQARSRLASARLSLLFAWSNLQAATAKNLELYNE